jgi:hypothetical protein
VNCGKKGESTFRLVTGSDMLIARETFLSLGKRRNKVIH